MNDKPTVRGALAGWRHNPTKDGVVVRFQIADSAQAHRSREFQIADIALNDRQLRSLGRDLTRIAHSRGIQLFARSSLRNRLSMLFSRIVGGGAGRKSDDD